VLAPGPSLMLAPALRVDRAINLARGRPGRVAVSVLVWCALAALLVMALFLLVRDATGRPGLAAALAFGFALVPPFLFYFHQFYPEMLGAPSWRRISPSPRPDGSGSRVRFALLATCRGCTRSSCRCGEC
jgi:hypothetical protein